MVFPLYDHIMWSQAPSSVSRQVRWPCCMRLYTTEDAQQKQALSHQG